MTLPSITVITPSLNGESTIQQTIDSVRAQRYDGPLEHIVVDGGSSDGTLEIVRAAGLRYVSEPDRGLSDALNKGLQMATGEVFGELNADDVYLPGALDRVGRAFSSSPGAEWVTGRCQIVDGAGRPIRGVVTRYKDLLLRRHSFRLHLVQNYISAPATFARTDVVRELGGFDERFRYSMDYDLWLRLGRRGDPVVIPEPIAAFRMAGDSLSLTGFERQFAEHAQNAREHGSGHRVAVALNGLSSKGIVAAYRLARLRRGRSR
ncbi:MAG TPA: glycosyltransferase family 2 protein [Solirubrobacteraceae bacterium]|nr:glycosyltransferase family 2 protein [Solirubrobacteraceae bacterium]